MPTIFAYLDPGSGSLILQALLGGAAAIGVGAKLWMARARRVLRLRQEAPPAATSRADTRADEAIPEAQAAAAATSDRAV